MKIQVKATNIKLTDAISDYLDKRLGAFDKYIDPEETSLICDVEVGRTTHHHLQGDIFRAEINLHVGGKSFRSVSEQETLYSAIDDVREEMSRVLRKQKQKQRTLVRRGAAQMKNLLRRFKR